MDDPVGVSEAQAAQQLVKEVLEVRVTERLRALDDAVQVRVEELHDDVELVGGAGALGHDEVLEADDVGMLAKPAHEPDFAQRVLAVDRRRAHRRDAL